jgi:membrane carboxypeptidase/penicillin-binding protein PbpC
VIYTLRRDSKKEAIELDAGFAGDVQNVFWFDGRALIARRAVSAGPLEWHPETDGVHVIRVIDDHGRSAEREVRVQFTR